MMNSSEASPGENSGTHKMTLGCCREDSLADVHRTPTAAAPLTPDAEKRLLKIRGSHDCVTMEHDDCFLLSVIDALQRERDAVEGSSGIMGKGRSWYA